MNKMLFLLKNYGKISKFLPAKTVLCYLHKTGDKNSIAIRYTIKNSGTEPLPYIWAGHMMFAGKPGVEVFSNAPADSGIPVMFGKAPEMPEKISAYAPDGEGYKYYITEPFTPLVCGIRCSSGDKVTVIFDGDGVRWLGVWMNNGSFKGMYNLALEPCTAPYDSPVNAEKEQTGYVRHVRLKQAGQLLAETQLTNDQIARNCGLKDIPTFYRLFKAQYGLTPNQYRMEKNKTPPSPENQS